MEILLRNNGHPRYHYYQRNNYLLIKNSTLKKGWHTVVYLSSAMATVRYIDPEKMDLILVNL